MAADISTLALEVDSTAVVRGRKDLDDLGAAGARSEGAANKVTSAWRAFSGVLATLGLGLAIRELVQVADTMSLLDSRLKLATKSSAEFLAAQADIYRIAQQNNVGIKETTELYVKLSEPIRALGGSTKEVAAISESFAASLRVGGASAQEASAATRQFAQAMASGVLRGDEFNSIAEASPRFMKAMADGMGVPTGALRKMAEDGKLTADVVGNALVGGLAKLQAESASMPDTVGGAFQRLNNDISLTVAKFNEATGATTALASGIGLVNDIVIRLSSVMSSSLADGVYKAGDSFDVLTASIRVVGTVFETLMVLGLNVSFVLKGMGREIGGIAAQLAALVTGDFKAFGSIRDEMVADSEAARKALDNETASIVGMTEKSIQARDVVKNFSIANSEVSSEMARLAGRVNAASGAFVTLKSAQEQTKSKGTTKAVVDEYDRLITSIKEKIAQQDAELNRGRELTKAEQLSVQITADLASGKLKLSKAQKENIDSAIALYDSTERLNEAKRSSAKLYEQSLSSAIKENQTIQQQIEALKLQTEEIGKSEFALALLAESRLYDAAAQKEAMAAMADGEDLTGRLGELYRQQAAALRDLAAAKVNFASVKDSNEQGIQSIADATKQLENFQSYIDKIDSSRLDGLFNGSLKGMEKLITSLEEFGRLQQKTDEAKEAANKKLRNGQLSQIEYEKLIAGIKQDSGRANIALTQQSISAIQTMTKEGSSAYKALTVAQAALGAATALSAIANQGLGDPYTAIPRILAMAATMAQLGFAVNGLSGGGSAPVTNQGTGTVFGDATAKSASINNSLKILETSRIGLKYSAQMANSLKNIEAAFAGVTNLVLRNGQIGKLESSIATGYVASSTQNTAANRLIAASGSFAQNLQNKLFGNKVSIQGSGILGGPQSFGDIQDIGFQGNYYADIETKKKFLGITRSTTNSTVLSELDEELSRQFTQIFTGIGDSILSASQVFGLRAGDIQTALSSYIVDIGKIDLKGLNGEQIQEKLAAVFGAEFDKLATAIIPGLESIQQVGEGYGETLVRAATQLESVNTTFALLGGSLSLFTKSADIFLEKMNGGFRATPGIDRAIVADALVQQFGGLEEFNSATQAFYESFYTQGERTSATLGLLNTSLEGIGLTLPDSIQSWRDLTTSLDVTTEAGRQAFETLITLGPTFADLQNQLLESAGISTSSIADVLRDGFTERITQEDLGKKLSGIVVDGFKNALANGVSEQISQSFTNQIIGPMLQAIATGGVVSAAISQETIDGFIAQAQTQIEAYTAIINDPQIQSALGRLQQGLNGVTAAMGGLTAASNAASVASGALPTYAAYGSYVVDGVTYMTGNATDLAAAANKTGDALGDAAGSFSSFGNAVSEEIKRIRQEILGLSDAGESFSLAQFTTLTAQARAGSLDAFNQLPGASQSYLSLAKNSAATLQDYRRAQGFILGSLTETNAMLGIGQQDSPITSSSVSNSFQSGSSQQSSTQLIQEIQFMRSEIERLRNDMNTGMTTSNQNTKKTADILNRVTEQGENMLVKDAA